jgi:membrane protease YdiL (CAAX protease family)
MENVVGRAKIAQGIGKRAVILWAALATLLFSLFRRGDTFLQLGNTLARWGWSAVPIFLSMALVRSILAGTVVLAVLPLVLGYKSVRDWLPGYLRIDRKAVVLGILSFVVFCVLATAISLSMGIFRGDLAAIFAHPDIRPDPDVVGWAYFFLALVPGIWEELAFRGLIQSKLRERFSIPASILLSAMFFGLFHLTNLMTQAPSQVIGGVIMAFLFGIAWGVMTVQSQSIIPAILSHYLVDSVGQVFMGVDTANPALATGFYLLLTLIFPVVNIVLVRVMYRKEALYQ